MSRSYLRRWFWWFFPKPIALELAEACNNVQGLRKEGYNEEEEFHYLKILDLANQLRAELLPRGIVIIPSDMECVETSWEIEGQIVTAIRVKTEFQITDGHRSLLKTSYGSARNGDYAVAVAQTMALKSLLKRLGLIFGDEADAEAQRWAPWPGERRAIRSYQERALTASLKSCNLTREGVEALLSKIMGFPITFEGIVALPRKDFDVAMKAISKHGDLTEVLEMSAAQVKRGPQPIAAANEQDRGELAGD
jgi:hypothetical protein